MPVIFDQTGHATEAGDVRVYYYDPMTFVYTGWSDEFINIGVSVPGCSTTVAPPEEMKGMAPVFNGSSWQLVPDHRGSTVYATDTQQSIVVDYLGEIKTGFTPLAPATPYDKWDGTKWVLDEAAKQSADTAENTAKKSALIFDASQVIAPLKDADDGGYIDDADKPKLVAWQKYRYELTKVDPGNPAWPTKPE
ncbi:tail fiber assembly protein [uncultured Citrobacter sp.]|uniref:tail fiber assembly protein n=1 Tax=uncultured Citrobacter sp. TaxID=200446 RepID=UPI00266D6315|nr:tail fiber assembly protein [uncultured Citrobacter sp.]